MGMMAQVPLSFISRFVEVKFGPRWGNLVMWFSIILGQPLCIMIYYHDYVITHHGQALMEDYGHVQTNRSNTASTTNSIRKLVFVKTAKCIFFTVTSIIIITTTSLFSYIVICHVKNCLKSLCIIDIYFIIIIKCSNVNSL